MCSHMNKMLAESTECKVYADLEGSHSYMTNKNTNIMLTITGHGYNCKFLVIEIGSWGYV